MFLLMMIFKKLNKVWAHVSGMDGIVQKSKIYMKSTYSLQGNCLADCILRIFVNYSNSLLILIVTG